MLPAGQMIDRYVVEAELGRGACAVVYRVRHTRLGSRHALKLLAHPPEALKTRLDLEGQIQARLRHPNIVAVTDVIVHSGMPGLVMDCIDGPDLGEWIATAQPDPDTAEAIFRGILAGLEHAHQLGVIHRDLKPNNVLLEIFGTAPVPRITDFGIAKDLDSSVNLTRTSVSMGTPRYMAPEQWRDSKNVDERADLFSMGSLLYEMVCGEPAFPQDNLPDIYAAVSSEGYIDPRTHRPDCPDNLYAAIVACLRPTPAERVPTCEVLRAILDGEPWTPPHLTVVPTHKLDETFFIHEDVPRRRPWFRAAVVTLLLGAVGIFAANTFHHQEPVVPSPPTV
ncbi:MAG: serine/threonine-protein kinase, partial [Myxococcota bacterium]